MTDRPRAEVLALIEEIEGARSGLNSAHYGPACQALDRALAFILRALDTPAAASEQAGDAGLSEPSLEDVIDALNVFNTPESGDEPWTAADSIMVEALPKFIHNVGMAWYAPKQPLHVTVNGLPVRASNPAPAQAAVDAGAEPVGEVKDDPDNAYDIYVDWTAAPPPVGTKLYTRAAESREARDAARWQYARRHELVIHTDLPVSEEQAARVDDAIDEAIASQGDTP